MKVFFPDTNLFLQCRELVALPWSEVADGEDVVLMVARSVQQEIDRLKQDGNSRRSSRARKVSSFIREVVLEENCELAVRSSSPRVVVSFPNNTQLVSEYPELDLSRADDRLIAEALTFRESHPELKVELLTHDTNPLLTARRCRLAFSVIPESWLLPPEPDSRDKRIAELEVKLKELERQVPRVDMSFSRSGREKIERIDVVVKIYNQLSEEELGGYVADLMIRHPVCDDFSAVGRFGSPSPAKIKEYQEELYPQWVKDVGNFLKSLSARLTTRCFPACLWIDNLGSLPAENTIVEIECTGGLLLEPPESNEHRRKDANVRLPHPPRPPKGRELSQITGSALAHYGSSSHFTNLLPLVRTSPPERDRNAFYWKPMRPSMRSAVWTLECDEFRHQIGPEKFSMEIFVPSVATGGLIKGRVTAKNLPKPVTLQVPVKIEYESLDLRDKIETLLSGNPVKLDGCK